MSEMENKNKPAFACSDLQYIQEGMSKREYFTALMLQSIISSAESGATITKDHIVGAITLADAALKTLDET